MAILSVVVVSVEQDPLWTHHGVIVRWSVVACLHPRCRPILRNNKTQVHRWTQLTYSLLSIINLRVFFTIWWEIIRKILTGKILSVAGNYYYMRKQLLLSACLSHRNSVRPSVLLFVTQVGQSKMVQDRITKSSPSAAWKTLVSGTVKLFHKFNGGRFWTRALNERGVGKICDFWPISCCLSNGAR